nr:GDP-mannose 4,6-dehydratase [Nocardioides convexus]
MDAVRDWGYAPEYVEGMWRMLQHDEPQDYVLATGIGTTVREFCQEAFSHAGLDWEEHVRYDKSYERPTEVDALIGDASKARDVLGWEARTDAKALAQAHGRRRHRAGSAGWSATARSERRRAAAPPVGS